MINDFDFLSLELEGFKENAVRDEIIYPIL